MLKENDNSPNTIQYGIWETRTDEKQIEAKQKITASIQNADLDLTLVEKKE